MNERMTAIVGAKISEFRRKMAEVNKIARTTASETVKKIGADASEFHYAMFGIRASLSQLKEKTTVEINARVDTFNKKLDGLADKIRTFGTVAGSAFRGGLISILPALSPIIGSAVGAVGGLASSFVAAGGAMGAFSIAAIGNIGKLTKSMSELKSLNEKIASTKDEEKLNELLKQRVDYMKGLSKEQKNAMKQVDTFKGAWTDFLKVTEKPVFQVFAAGLGVATSLLDKIKPIIQPVADVLTILLNRFNAFSETKQFKSFIEFFATRGSSALESWGTIAGNVFTGFMELMKAFAPLGKDMEGGLVGLTEKFSKWAAKISESKGFQNFINFVKENGPKVMDLIGNLTTFLVNLGIGMAPLGTKILDLVNSFLAWTNGMMKNHPMIGKIIAVVLSLGGVLLALTPFIFLVQSAFGGMAAFIWLKTGMMRAKLVTGVAMMVKSLGTFIAKMATTVAKFVAQSAVFIAKMVATAAKFVAKWTLMGTKALLHAGKVAAAWTLATGKKMVTAMAKMVAQSAIFVGKWLLMGTKSLIHAGKIASAWALATGKKMVISLAKMVATSAVFVAKWAWMGAQALLNAGKIAAAWFIALGPIGWVIAAVIALVALIIANWDSIWKWTKIIFNKVWKKVQDAWGWISDAFDTVKDIVETAVKKFNEFKKSITDTMDEVWGNITDIWDDVMEFFEDIDLKKIGMNIIEGLVNGIQDIDVMGAIKGVAGNIKDGFTDFFTINSPSRVMKGIGGHIVGGLIVGLEKAKSPAERMAERVASAVQRPFDRMNKEFTIGATAKATIQPMTTSFGVSGISANVPTDQHGAPDSYSSREETHVNMAGVFQGAELTIREDADIDRIAQALGERVKDSKRARGIR
jgi:hypothetical protein